jgi:retron-type reverse transcriptase
MSWLTVSNAFSASTVRSSKSRLHFLYINIVSDAINATEICSITNQIIEELNIPDILKRGISTPVLKKKKDKTLPGNYRGIVVTNTFSKIIESVIKERLEKQLSPTQNPLQRGFTEHASSKFTAFIASETILIYKKFNRDLELLTVDAEKAFDTVNHDIMLNKLYHDGITGDM